VNIDSTDPISIEYRGKASSRGGVLGAYVDTMKIEHEGADKKMKSKTIAGLIAIAAIVALGTVTILAAETTLPPGYTWYEDEEFKFKIAYPENWTIVPKEEITIIDEDTLGVAMFRDPDTTNMIFVSVLSEYDMEELKAIGAKKVVINGREGYEAIIQPMPPVKMKLIAFAVADRYYLISCTTSVELFDEYVDIFDNAINSFVIEYPAPVTPTPVFDTGSGTYPSIMGTHKGVIKPSDNITISKLYTYPCAGTGGHTKTIKLEENGRLIASGTWDGYQSDWHNITLHNVSGAPYVKLLKGHKYNYTIVTGSYPQIIHAKSKDVTGGTIMCDKFVDANGRIYYDWIPAIKLFL